MDEEFEQPSPVPCVTCGKLVSVWANACGRCDEPKPAYLKDRDGKPTRTEAKKAWDEEQARLEKQERVRLRVQAEQAEQAEQAARGEWLQTPEGQQYLAEEKREKFYKSLEAVPEMAYLVGSNLLLKPGVLVGFFSGVAAMGGSETGLTIFFTSCCAAGAGLALRLAALKADYVPPPPKGPHHGM